jgi:hypothetical protein
VLTQGKKLPKVVVPGAHVVSEPSRARSECDRSVQFRRQHFDSPAFLCRCRRPRPLNVGVVGGSPARGVEDEDESLGGNRGHPARITCYLRSATITPQAIKRLLRVPLNAGKVAMDVSLTQERVYEGRVVLEGGPVLEVRRGPAPAPDRPP